MNIIVLFDKIVYLYRKRQNSLSSTTINIRINNQLNAISEFIEYSNKGKIDYTCGMDAACSLLDTVLSYISKLPRNKERQWMTCLRNRCIFPISRNDISNINIKYNNKLLYLKNHSYTEIGYAKLKNYNRYLRLKLLIKRMLEKLLYFKS